MEQLKLTVRQLNMYVRSLLEGDANLASVMLVGEIFDFKRHYSSGHLYFSLKDKDASIKTVMFKGNAETVKFLPKDGMQVICRGYVSLYERDGAYQFYAQSMEIYGAGALSMEFERIKSKLESEGLFDVKRKKPLPTFPQKIGVVTSATGAALQDIINVLSRRYPICTLVLFPALVQGISAPQSLIDALNKAYNVDDIDVIIIGRGGGSSEELSCFNDEQLAYKISESKKPVISAVGHETDFTICDFVSDMRAPTPSAAAEIVSPDITDIKRRISVLKEQIKISAYGHLCDYNTKLEFLRTKRCLSNPEKLFSPFALRLENAVVSLNSAYNCFVRKKETEFFKYSSKMVALSPDNVLKRGYSLAYQNGKIIKRKNDIAENSPIDLRLYDGTVKLELLKEKNKNG